MRALRGVVAAVLVLGFTVPPAALADDLDEELERVASRIETLEAQLDATAGTRTALADEILATQARIGTLRVELDEARVAADEATRQLNLGKIDLELARDRLRRTNLALADTRANLATGREEAKVSARSLYIAAGREMPEILVSATTISDVSLTVAYLERATQSTEAAIVELEALEQLEARQVEVARTQEQELADQVTVLAIAEERAAEQRDVVAAKKAEVERELARQASLLAELDHEIEHFEGEIVALEKEQARIESLLAAEQSSGGSAPSGFVRPVPGAITSGYGIRIHPILGTARLHTGVDMSAGHGEPIKASAAGRVILAGRHGGYGNTVIIDHGGGMATLYAHQSSLEVSYGEQVDAGEVIGYVGSTGFSTGPHLHFEVRLDGAPVDPAPYL